METLRPELTKLESLTIFGCEYTQLEDGRVAFIIFQPISDVSYHVCVGGVGMEAGTGNSMWDAEFLVLNQTIRVVYRESGEEKRCSTIDLKKPVPPAETKRGGAYSYGGAIRELETLI